MVECPKCKSTNLQKCHWDEGLCSDNPGPHHRSPLGAAFVLGSAVAKMTLASVYVCKGCGHKFRKWFPKD
jgi:hypothetical protein